jgi:hypothetical protein
VIALNIIFLIQTIPTALSDPSYLNNIVLAGVNVTTINWALIVVFICTAFLYLGIKSSGRYRLYSLIIFVGWAANQIINAYGQLIVFSALLNAMTLIFIIKIVAATVAAYGFVKLYGMRG